MILVITPNLVFETRLKRLANHNTSVVSFHRLMYITQVLWFFTSVHTNTQVYVHTNTLTFITMHLRTYITMHLRSHCGILSTLQ